MTKKSPTQKMPGLNCEDFGNYTALSPRLQRLLQELLRGPQTVQDLMCAIPANSPPAYVHILRQHHGFSIPCEHVPHIDRDGTKGWHGLYGLTPADRLRAAKLLGDQ